MSPVLSPQVLADICQHHKPIGPGKALELAVCARDMSSAGAAAGVAGALAELPSWGLCTAWAMLGSASCHQYAALLVTPVKGELTRKNCPVLAFSFVVQLGWQLRLFGGAGSVFGWQLGWVCCRLIFVILCAVLEALLGAAW